VNLVAGAVFDAGLLPADSEFVIFLYKRLDSAAIMFD